MNCNSTYPNIYSFPVEEKAKDKNDVHIKKEIIPISGTTKLSYHDVLIKGSVNENKDTEGLISKCYKHESKSIPKTNTANSSYHDILVKDKVSYYKNKKAVRDLMCKGIKILSLFPESSINKYNLNSEYFDDLPIAQKETEQDKLMWDSFCEAYKDTEAGKYFNKALK
jgi:hypothetical protein